MRPDFSFSRLRGKMSNIFCDRPTNMDIERIVKKRLERTSLWMRTINRDCWCDKNRFLTLGISCLAIAHSQLSVLSLVRHWPLWLFGIVSGKKKNFFRSRADQIRPAKKRSRDQQGCGWWNSVIAKQPKLGRRREIVGWLGTNLLRGGTFFRWCFQCATLLAIEWEQSQVFLSYVCCVGV